MHAGKPSVHIKYNLSVTQGKKVRKNKKETFHKMVIIRNTRTDFGSAKKNENQTTPNILTKKPTKNYEITSGFTTKVAKAT